MARTQIEDYSNNKLEGFSSVCMCSSQLNEIKSRREVQGGRAKPGTIAATFEHVRCIKFTLWESSFTPHSV